MSSVWTAVPNHHAYRSIRQRVTDMVADRPGVGDLPVPACPQWTVRDLVGHLDFICGSVLTRLTGRPAPAGDDTDLAGLLAHWAATGERMESALEATGGGNGIVVMDAFVHELDIRVAVGLPPPDGHPAQPTAMDVLIRGFGDSVRAHRLPALRVETDGTGWTAGDGEPAAVLTGSPWHLSRSLAGRRTEAQIAALDWSRPAPVQWLPAFTWGLFRPPAAPVEGNVGEHASAAIEQDSSCTPRRPRTSR
jgi:uncharacterized protein (TIGR03083 family)